MKKYLLALSAFLLVAVATNAQTSSSDTTSANMHRQNAHHAKSYAMHRHHEMMKDLNLTDAQKQQVKALRENYKSQESALEKNGSITLKDYREKKAGLEKERKAKFESILTADQQNQMAMNKQQRGEKMKLRSEKRLSKMKTDLNLTEAQVAKIKEQHDGMMMQAKSIKQNTSLTDAQKKEQFMQLRKTGKESMNNILTADQLKKKEELRSERMKDWKNKQATKES